MIFYVKFVKTLTFRRNFFQSWLFQSLDSQSLQSKTANCFAVYLTSVFWNAFNFFFRDKATTGHRHHWLVQFYGFKNGIQTASSSKQRWCALRNSFLMVRNLRLRWMNIGKLKVYKAVLEKHLRWKARDADLVIDFKVVKYPGLLCCFCEPNSDADLSQ